MLILPLAKVNRKSFDVCSVLDNVVASNTRRFGWET